MDLLSKYDIVGICETWLGCESEYTDLLEKFYCYNTVNPKGNRRGRNSGGISVFVKYNLKKGIKRLLPNYKKAIFLLFKSSVLGLKNDLLYVSAYIPPEYSPVYEESTESNGIEELRGKLEEVILSLENNDLDILLAGDLNARTGNNNDFIDDNIVHLPVGDWYNMDNFNIPRNSMDITQNNFGIALLDLCRELGIHILNGRNYYDTTGEFTCITYNGASVVDYFVVSSNLYNYIEKFEILHHISDSKHFPVICVLKVQSTSSEEEESVLPRVRYKWDNSKKIQFVENLNTLMEEDKFINFERHIEDGDINGATDMLVCTLQEAIKYNKRVQRKHIAPENKQQQPPWWDDECNQAKISKYCLLNNFRRDKSSDNLKLYIEHKKSFKDLCNIKTNIYKNNMYTNLKDSVSDRTLFWKNIKSLSSCKSSNPAISGKSWCKYFKELLNVNVDIDDEFSLFIKDYLLEHDEYCEPCSNRPGDDMLNRDITTEEIASAIKSLRSSKAPGLDGLEGELFKENQIVLIPLLHILFNCIMRQGAFPESWSKAMLIPIHKKGDKNNPNNYRGISLIDVISKIFTKILNTRLVNWADDNDKMFQEQCGFTKGKSTVDQIFILNALVQKYLTKKGGRFYCIYVDFSKAFDSVPHLNLWFKLISSGVHGNVIKVLRSMYEQIKSCVFTGEGLSDFFE